MMRPYQLPAPPQARADGWVTRARVFLLRTWRGRILLIALAVWLAAAAGLPFAEGPANLASVVLWIYGIFGAWRLSRIALRRLLWRIRTKLLVSYLFIAVVPLVLLGLLFVLAGVLFTGLVASHMVSSEIERVGETLRDTARATLTSLPPEGPGFAAALERQLAPARAVHPNLRYAIVRAGRVLASAGDAPRELPPWWQGPGFAGIAKLEKTEVVRGVWTEGGAFVVLDAPLDAPLFAELEKRTGIRLLMTGGTVKKEDVGIDIRLSPDETRKTEAGEPREEIAGEVFFATPERTVWATGEKELDGLGFGYKATDLIRRLSPPGTLNTADLLVKVLAVVGVIFLVMYSVALGLGLLLARSITRSVHELSVGTERLREGDFHHEIRIKTRDQLGDLAESFNMMSRGIQDLLRQTADKERLEEELRIARQIQMSLLPAQGAVTLSGLRIAALCLPAAEVGGDYYDLLPLSDTRMGVLIADVSGKGTSAALYMAELKGLVLSLSRVYDSPARLLCEANRILSAHMDSRSFVTMTYAIVDTGARTMRYARAGHNPILHLEARSGKTRVLTPPGLGLGIDRGSRFEEILEEAELPLASGDLFLFFTDGLSEAMNVRAELFGEQRLRDILEESESLTSDELKERILTEIRAFVGDAAQHDDMTLVILKVA